MLKGKLWLCVIPAVLTVAACAPKVDTAADEAAIAKMNENVTRWFANKNADSLAAGYAEDAVDMNSNAPPSKGRAAIQKAYADLFAAPGSKLTISPKSTHVAASGDMAVSGGTFALSMTGPGGAPIEDSGNYVVVLKKTNGTWLVTQAIGTSDRPLPPPPAPTKKGK